MIEIIKSLVAGFILGGFFYIFKLPLPAPPVLAGVVGIFGVYFGYTILGKFL